MKKLKKHFLILIVVLLPLSFTFQSCEEDGAIDRIANGENVWQVLKDEINKRLSQLGWLMDDEDPNNIPDDIDPFDDDTDNLPAALNLADKLPPVGDQGQYGTCVTWATGYNLKTAMDAIANDWTANDLKNTANQTSPKDLWLAIPSNKKGAKCEGTNFEPALNVLTESGAAPLSQVPYSSLGDCSGTAKGNSNNLLTSYRKIAYNESKQEGMTVENFKGYLSTGRPIAIGAKLGDNFMTWDSKGDVLSYDTYGYTGQHAYHAMVLIGYDDSKNAFLVRNSWGTSWGNSGSIWIDYDFFLDEFCFAAFVANNETTDAAKQKAKGPYTGNDLMAYFAKDAATSETNLQERKLSYEIYNSGEKAVNQSTSVIYMYYNAANARDFGILAKNEISGIGVGEKISKNITYTMPPVTGKYYLAVIVNPYGDFSEENENNNFFYITTENSKPIEFVNGVMQNAPVTVSNNLSKPATFADTKYQTTVVPGNLNSYKPEEIRTVLTTKK